ncbi:hypothetical protein [Sphingomonas adhaesiva]|uniref:hypothetical protein n=1 Tax=Sphingomonas adhaesiva TaxID=28212 RepID=UPI002FFA3BB8
MEPAVEHLAGGQRTGFPYRHAARLLNAYQFRIGTMGWRAFDGQNVAMLLFFMIYRAALRDPDNYRISVNAIATSLRQSTETLRRAARLLVARELCRPAARGIERAPGFLDHPLTLEIGGHVEQIFEGILSDYRRSGLTLPTGIGERSTPERVAAALDAYLSVLELTESRIIQPVVLHVTGAVTVLNAAHLVEDVELGLLYGQDDTVPPAVLRRPATAQQVAAESGLAPTTVWRHLSAACDAGILRRVADGYLLADRLMSHPVTSARSREKIEYLHRVFHDLAKGRYAVLPTR